MKRNPKGRNINGIVLLDKDPGMTSNAALQKIKRLFFAKKAGHTGALDPLASGILPICLGQATKVARFLLDEDKRYFVRGQLGLTTTTGDSQGAVIKTQSSSHLGAGEIITAVQNFLGEITQVPPMYSALKKNGQPLYKLARQGIEIERAPRPAKIYKIDYLSYKKEVLSLEVSCSKGTYIRTLVEDIGEQLGCGAHVVELRRIGFAHIDITQTIRLADLDNLAQNGYRALDKKILATEDMLPKFKSVYLNAQQSIDIQCGIAIESLAKQDIGGWVKLFDEKKQFLGIGQYQKNGIIAPKRLFI